MYHILKDSTPTCKVFVLKWCFSLGFYRSFQHSIRLLLLGDEGCGRISGSVLCVSIVVLFFSIE